MRKRVRIALIAVIAVGSIILVGFWPINMLTRQEINQWSDFLAPDVKTVGPHYLSRPPYFPNNSFNMTRIFLESATLRHGYSNASFAANDGYKVPGGAPVVIINCTIRNDYTAEEILQFSQEGITDCYVGLDVYLYDKQSNFVNTLHRGNPFRGCYEVSLKGGETASFYVVFVTSNKDVDHFEVYVSYLRPIPEF